MSGSTNPPSSDANQPSGSGAPLRRTGLPGLPEGFNETLRETGSIAAAMGDTPTPADNSQPERPS